MPLYILEKIENPINGSIAIFWGSKEKEIGEKQPVVSTLYLQGQGSQFSFCEISSQVGCIVGCDFCGCGKFKYNLLPTEILQQIEALQNSSSTMINKINFSDGGELLLNPNAEKILQQVSQRFPLKIKISSVFPSTRRFRKNLEMLLDFKKKYNQIVLQISLSSTNEELRMNFSKIPLMNFEELRSVGERWYRLNNGNRTSTLTFTLMEGSHCDPLDIVEKLPPEFFKIRLHPFKPNGTENNTIPNERLVELKRSFEKQGYEIIDENEQFVTSSQLTLSGTKAFSLNLLGMQKSTNENF